MFSINCRRVNVINSNFHQTRDLLNIFFHVLMGNLFCYLFVKYLRRLFLCCFTFCCFSTFSICLLHNFDNLVSGLILSKSLLLSFQFFLRFKLLSFVNFRLRNCHPDVSFNFLSVFFFFLRFFRSILKLWQVTACKATCRPCCSSSITQG